MSIIQLLRHHAGTPPMRILTLIHMPNRTIAIRMLVLECTTPKVLTMYPAMVSLMQRVQHMQHIFTHSMWLIQLIPAIP